MLELEGLLRLPRIPAECSHNGHMFYLLLDCLETRSALIEKLDSLGVNSVFHYVPLHLSPMGKRLGYRRGQLPRTEDLSERLLRLPTHFELAEEDQARVIDGIWQFFRGGQA